MRKLLRQNSTGVMVFDGSIYDTFFIECSIPVVTLRVNKVSPGHLYVFVLVQDWQGKHKFNWGASIRNGANVNLAPNGTTVQCFVGMAGNILQGIPPGTWI